jgi:hypothetical protein
MILPQGPSWEVLEPADSMGSFTLSVPFNLLDLSSCLHIYGYQICLLYPYEACDEQLGLQWRSCGVK